MARGLFRKPSFNKMVGAYRSQWKRALFRFLTFGAYGSKGMGWLRNPRKACYNWWYHRTSISIPRLLGYRPSRASFFCAMLAATAISLFMAPVDIVRAGAKAHKIGKAYRASRKKKASASSGFGKSGTRGASSGKSSSKSTASGKSGSKSTNSSDISKIGAKSTASGKSGTKSTASSKPKKPTIQMGYTPVVNTAPQKKVSYPSSPELFLSTTKMPAAPAAPAPQTAAPDENAPKSRPKHKDDQYIRKRMIIAGTSYCDKAALDKLTIGTYFELVAEPTNPHDKDAIMLVHEGEKIGYISQQDKPAFVTCLRLNRKVYGVITDIIPAPYPSKYEFETWFDKSPSTET